MLRPMKQTDLDNTSRWLFRRFVLAGTKNATTQRRSDHRDGIPALSWRWCGQRKQKREALRCPVRE